MVESVEKYKAENATNKRQSLLINTLVCSLPGCHTVNARTTAGMFLCPVLSLMSHGEHF